MFQLQASVSTHQEQSQTPLETISNAVVIFTKTADSTISHRTDQHISITVNPGCNGGGGGGKQYPYLAPGHLSTGAASPHLFLYVPLLTMAQKPS